MELKRGMIVRLKKDIGGYKKMDTYIVKKVIGNIAFAKSLEYKHSIAIYRYSENFEEVKGAVFYI